MSGQIEPLPESFLAKILSTYGLHWTHLAVISGVIFSSFSLEKYLDPGLWVLGTVAGLGAVMIYQASISSNFVRTSLLAALVGLVLVVIPLVILNVSEPAVSKWIQKHSEIATLYLALAVSVPLGLSILSYRKQPDLQLAPLPEVLKQAVERSVTRANFVNESVDYSFELHLKSAPDAKGHFDVTLRYELTFNVWNRSKSEARYSDLFDPAGYDKRFFYAAINREVIDHDAPERLSGLGLRLEKTAAPDERFQVIVRAESSFGVPGSELIGSYLPSSNMVIRVKPPPPGLRVYTQDLASVPLNKQKLATGDLVVTAEEAVLPYQGIRLYWEKSNDLL